MSDPFADVFEQLDSEPVTTTHGNTAQDAPATAIERRPDDAHTCHECSGTGRYQGVRRHQEKEHCFSCKGRGWFRSSYADRMKAKQQREARKRQQLTDKVELFCEAHPGLYEGLQDCARWSPFAASLVESIKRWGGLTDKQLGAAEGMLAKVAATHARREAERTARNADVGNVARIRQMFDAALAAGKTKRALLAARYERDTDGSIVLGADGRPTIMAQISLTPARAPRTEIWAKVDGEFCGGISEDGVFKPRREAPEWLAAELQRLAADPETLTRLYGRATGNCCCCGRELTNADSIEAGIGPVCATKWGV